MGLIRSPMRTNGRSKPMTTSRVGEERTVSVNSTPPAAASSLSVSESSSDSSRAASASTSASRSSPQGRLSRTHSARYSSVPNRPAYMAARSMATWNRADNSRLAVSLPLRATTCAGI